MCLGEVARVTEVRPDLTALVHGPSRTITVSLITLDDPVAPGDWLLVHSGFALARLTPEDAAEAVRLRSTASPPTPDLNTRADDR